ncbi:NAD(P)-dependent dehydrogenase (short-subunit alcohol dehydrogenase family) [Williamsia limnetica]|uniref:NAD(P)-dependent dehydrogenase (Short-subunit alcohol dehydrogenase family) n=2 Tax=Williamsia limnetica TaxID=882452 RepID=A0A318RS78_WILLI|nr:NAD(P)-dependent dehydrogenase (short-subunit alcohol dehydrogenase family) [Williamsia limnetica]
MEMDVTDSQSIDNIFQQVRNRLGPVSVLVNNAGIIARGPAKDLSEDEWRRVLETDLTGVFLCSKAAFSHMSNLGGGSIINVGSIAGFVGLAGRLAYTTAKAGLSGFTRTLALEWAKDGIRVNTVAPGWTRTEMVVKGLQAGLLDENVLVERIPQKRLADPSEIASAVRFFASPESSYVTGQTLIVDGGFTINGH